MTDPRDTDKKPCSVKARQGFSVYYRNRYLYSQYDAEKPVTRLIDSLTILPETLVLAYSPVLGTGLNHLLERLPAGCHVLAVEFAPELYDFFMKTDAAEKALSDSRFSAVLLERPEDITSLAVKNKLRRCLTVDMSGGTAFHADEYRLTTKYADDAIATFWKNHITLTRMGRLYARNLFTNTTQLSEAPLSSTRNLKPHSVSKPLLALGAGPSLDELLPVLAEARNNFFILAADAALPALAQHGIRPDAVIAVESQIAIEKAYIGFEGSRIPLIADMTSRPRVLSIMKGPVSFFMTEYCNEPFIARFRKLAEENGIPVFPPLGSVGLYTLETALYLRTTETPVFFSGLDFAWGKGSTHCKGAPAHTNALLTASRLNPAGNPAAAFGNGTFAFTGKNGETGYSTPNLSGYGKLLSARYRKTHLLFDVGSTGMETGIERISIENMLLNAKKHALNAYTADFSDITWLSSDAPVSGPISENAASFLAAEYDEVKLILELIDAYDDASNGERLQVLLEEHSYLYLHFPDAARGPLMTRDFLARVKMEAERLLTYLSGC